MIVLLIIFFYQYLIFMIVFFGLYLILLYFLVCRVSLVGCGGLLGLQTTICVYCFSLFVFLLLFLYSFAIIVSYFSIVVFLPLRLLIFFVFVSMAMLIYI